MPFDATNPPVSSPLLSVLIEGRRRIESSWFQGPGLAPSMNDYCAVLAISRQNVGELGNTALEALAFAIGTNIDIAVWNDKKETTKQKVLDIYDAAIVREIERINATDLGRSYSRESELVAVE